jgi:glycosyltransferase involved in cell wall biosynthesis
LQHSSTDKSKEIAIKYAKKDNRIRIHDNKKFLKLMQNWNYSMHQISPKSKYCKVVHADDWLFPECIEKMVEVAEKNPSVGIVSAYRLDETRISLDGLPYPSTIVSGRLICRLSLLENMYVFGSPTSTLIRSVDIRARDKFYEEHSIHADEEVCYEILKKADFGFVHQVLTYTRRHNESVTSLNKIYNTHKIRMLIVLKKYGSFFLGKEEYNKRLKRLINNHHKYLGHSFFELKNKDFFNYHIKELRKLDIKLNYLKLMAAVIKELLNPLNTFKIIIKNIKEKAVNT